MRHLKNLISSQLVEGPAPWDFSGRNLVPQNCLGNDGKKNRDSWINTPSTEYHVYSLYEGLNPCLRISKSAYNGEGNPPVIMYGIAADYDTDISLEEVMRVKHRFGIHPPTWFEQTLSSNCRLVWLFEKPLPVPSREYLLRFLEEAKTWLNLGQLPGLDLPALKTPERYFTNGGIWHRISDKPISADETRGFSLRVTSKFEWVNRDHGKAVSWEAITEECRRKYDRFKDWPYEVLAPGQQGPSFWIEGSTSPKSAIVLDVGFQTFSAHATKGMYTFKEVVGSQFVESVEDAHLGKAIDGIVTDGKTWYIEETTGRWQDYDSAGVRRRLMVRGLSDRRAKGETVDSVTKAQDHLASNCRVDIAATLPFFPKGLIQLNHQKILNLHFIEAMQPAEGPVVWGPGGEMPFLSSYFSGLFDPADQLDYFMSWTARFYRACLERKPNSGHVVILCGPPNAGKTFCATAVISRLVGGHANANAYFNGNDSFNSELFLNALWCMDDGNVSNTAAQHRQFSENVKRVAANRYWRSNEKFKKAANIPWLGRAIITCNDDPESLQQLPNMDISIREKLMMFRVGVRKIEFPDSEEMEKILLTEIPFLARYLLDWKVPKHCLQDSDVRFGLSSYCEPSLSRAANLSNGQSAFVELLLRWVKDFFAGNPEVSEWRGTATDLRLAMSADMSYENMLRVYRIEQFSRMLVSTSSKNILNLRIEDSSDGDIHRTFIIPRPSSTLPKATPSLPNSNTKIDKKPTDGPA